MNPSTNGAATADPAAPQPAAAGPQHYTAADKQPAEVTTEPTPPEDLRTHHEPLRERASTVIAENTATWLGFFRQPPSIAEAWDLSSIIDRNRIPGESGLVANLWWLFNRTERIALFAIIFVLAAVLSTLLYCARRPMGRIGLYVVVLLVFVIVPAIAGG